MVDYITLIHDIGDPAFLSVFTGPTMTKGVTYRFTVGDDISDLLKKHALDNLCINLQPLAHNLPDNATDPSAPFIRGISWQFIDLDSLRDADPVTGIKPPATDEQRAECRRIAKDELIPFMVGIGYGFPVIIDSGNGIQLMFPVGMPLTRIRSKEEIIVGWVPLDISYEYWMSCCLKYLSKKFSTLTVGIDESVYNLARLCRLPGSLNVKAGRHAELLFAEYDWPPTEGDVVKKLGMLWPQPTGKRGSSKKIEGGVPALIADAGLEIKKEKAYGKGGTLWELSECPKDSTHTRGEAFIVEDENGRLGGTCQHETCDWDFWTWYKEMRPEESGANLSWLIYDFPYTDIGNSYRFAKMHGENVKYVVGRGWYVYDEDLGVWVHDVGGLRVQGLAKETANTMYDASTLLYEEEQQKNWAKWVKHTSSDSGINSMVKLSRNELTLSGTVFDRHKNILCCPEGIIDLTTGALWEHGRQWYLTHYTTVNYDPAATCPVWEQFIDDMFRKHPEDEWLMGAFLQKLCGYMITGKRALHLLIVLFGLGANGKSEFLWVLRHILSGDGNTNGYGGVIKFGSFTAARQGSTHTADLMHVPGLLLLTTGEGNRKEELNEGDIKSFTAEETIRLRGVGESEDEYPLQATCIIASNRKPRVVGRDDGIWRRLVMIPFQTDFRKPPFKRVDDYGRVVIEQDGAAGILNWLVKGAVAYNTEGLEFSDFPDLVKNQTIAWKYDEDIHRRIIEACFEFTDDYKRDCMLLDDAYDAYIDTCKMMDIPKSKWPSTATFADILDGYGITSGTAWSKKHKDPKYQRLGIRLRGAGAVIIDAGGDIDD